MSAGKSVFLLSAIVGTIVISPALSASEQASATLHQQTVSAKPSRDNLIRLAQGASEKEAFEGAKELGTLEAWEAFLNNFPSGFRADLARAYVRRLGTEEPAVPAPATITPPPPPPPVAPQPQPVYQRPPPPPPPAPVLQPIHLGPDATPWGNGNYAMDEGNASAFSASVRSSGLEFTTFCNHNRQLVTVVGEFNRGVYPEFDQRIEQGLSSSIGQYGTNDQRLSIHFTNGNEHILPANVMGLTGEVSINSDKTGSGFQPGGSFVNDLMSAQSFTISSPPMGVTFQLTNSRRAICSVLKQCGVSTPGCARFEPRPVSTYTPPKKKKIYKKKTYTKKKKSGCPGGTVYLEGQCIKKSQVTSFCGPGYKKSGSKCVTRYPDSAQQAPQQQQNAPTGLQILQGIAGALQQ
jgi:hypothetical protein